MEDKKQNYMEPQAEVLQLDLGGVLMNVSNMDRRNGGWEEE